MSTPLEPLPVTVGLADDVAKYVRTDLLTWFDEEGSQTAEERAEAVPVDQRFAAQLTPDAAPADPSTYAGIYGVRPMRGSVPDATPLTARVIEVAGLTWVAVHPDHRRRGILSAMMRDHLERTHAAGLPMSWLHASEPVIYGRFGYGPASVESAITIGRGATFAAAGLDEEVKALTTTLVTLTPELAERIRAVDLRNLGQAVGGVVPELPYYDTMCRQTPEELRDKERERVLFVQRDGVDVGRVLLRREHKWERAQPSGVLHTGRIIGDPAARLALLRRLVDFDLMGSVKLHGVGAGDPIWQWIGPRGGTDGYTVDSLWVRIVDLPAALAQRGYAADASVVVDVTDRYAERNVGRWRIAISGGEANATRTEDAAEIALDIAALGSAYLGTNTLATQWTAGLITELRPGAVVELSRAFRTDVAPTAALGF